MKKKRIWKNSDLLCEFRRFNRLHFGGKLKEPLTLKFGGKELGHTFTYRTLYGSRKDVNYGITISAGTRSMRRVWLGTLLHEMVHLEQGNKYSCGAGGWKFNNRMKQLAKDGALNGIW